MFAKKKFTERWNIFYNQGWTEPPGDRSGRHKWRWFAWNWQKYLFATFIICFFTAVSSDSWKQRFRASKCRNFSGRMPPNSSIVRTEIPPCPSRWNRPVRLYTLNQILTDKTNPTRNDFVFPLIRRSNVYNETWAGVYEMFRPRDDFLEACWAMTRSESSSDTVTATIFIWATWKSWQNLATICDTAKLGFETTPIWWTIG